MSTYVTTYCNKPHRLTDGAPVAHECYVLPPRALELERDDKTAEAITVLESAKPLRVSRGVRASVTLADLKAKARELGCTVRKQDGEYRVNLKGASEESAAYESDAESALGTMQAMAKWRDSRTYAYRVALWRKEWDRQCSADPMYHEDITATDPDAAGRAALKMHADCEYSEVSTASGDWCGEVRR